MKVKLFARLKDILGEEIDVKGGIPVKELKNLLYASFPEETEHIPILVAVNGSYVSDDYIIKDSDEVVAFPPVSGG